MQKLLSGLLMAGLALLTACGGEKQDVYPQGSAHVENGRIKDESRGKLTGDEGWVLFGGKKKSEDSGANIGVNGFIWRATLDTLSFMPIASADPFGGVVLTDWYEDPKTPGMRYKVNAYILDRSLRADAVKVKIFKQAKTPSGWRDQAVSSQMSRDLEDTILTRARELRVSQLESK
jgi:hypothetical protein